MFKYLESHPITVIFILLTLMIMLFIEIGFRTGIRSRTKKDAEAPNYVGTIVAGLLGMLAFLLAFTFNMAATQHEKRKLNVVIEANNIGTAYLRSDLIDEKYGQEIKRLLHEYVDIRVNVAEGSMGFEKGVIRKLAQEYDALSEHLLGIYSNIKDLMIPFQQKHYVTPSMNGSYSIKYVLPALVPEMEQAYKELDGVQNGGEAMQAFANLSKLDDIEKQKKRNELLEYCKLDTLAMVKILEKLHQVIDEEK